MFLRLHQLCIHLDSEDALINQGWDALFSTWPGARKNADPACGSVDIRLSLALTETFPPLPAEPPSFTDSNVYPDGSGILSVYQRQDARALLHFLDGALVNVPLAAQLPPGEEVAAGHVTRAALRHGRLEDITYTSLAPLLRRRGYYLVHAFAACKDDRAALIVGPSGSGKTTTGLCLLLNGWQLLSNDILLLEEREGQIFALPTPGTIGVRPPSGNFLPELRPFVANAPAGTVQVDVTRHFIGDGRWPSPAPVTAVYFPKIRRQPRSYLTPEQRAVCLALLMAESIDRWDSAMLPAHIALLQKLSQQAAAYALELGQDFQLLPELFHQSA